MALHTSRTVKAQRGSELRCRGWRQEALLRMLENVLEVGERPEDLVVYSGTAKAARDWESYDRIVHALTVMEEDQTLLVQSGKPVGLFQTSPLSPMVLTANANVVGEAGMGEAFDQLVMAGLSVWGGMTAGAWQYIGTQGILQGTYETFMAAGREHFGGSLAGRLIVTAGLGGMSGAQPLAGVLAGAVVLTVEADGRRLERRMREGYLQRSATDLDQALAVCLEAKQRGEAVSVGLVDNIAAVLPELLARGVIPDIVTDQTNVMPRSGYIPLGMSPAEAEQLGQDDFDELNRRALETAAIHTRAMLDLGRQGAVVFEYGNGLRNRALQAGVEDAFEMPGFIERYVRPLFCRGFGPFRWVALSGDPADIAAVDDLIVQNFPGHPIIDWIGKARVAVRHTIGLPARIGWLGYGERSKLGLLVNEAVGDGRISAPVAFTRDHLDSGSVAAPYRETENMLDGSDAISDWPLLNALLSCASRADLVAIHSHFGRAVSAGLTLVADGTPQAAERLQLALTNDPGIGVLRHADAGYQVAQDTAAGAGLGLPA